MKDIVAVELFTRFLKTDANTSGFFAKFSFLLACLKLSFVA